jgi:hypothetical protein
MAEKQRAFRHMSATAMVRRSGDMSEAECAALFRPTLAVRLEAMITIARYGRTTRPRPQRAIAMTVLFVVAIPTA